MLLKEYLKGIFMIAFLWENRGKEFEKGLQHCCLYFIHIVILFIYYSFIYQSVYTFTFVKHSANRIESLT